MVAYMSMLKAPLNACDLELAPMDESKEESVAGSSKHPEKAETQESEDREIAELEKAMKIVQISNIKAESNARVFAGYNDNSQTYHTHHHQHIEQPEPRPEPLSTTPFPHDPDFVNRDALKNLHQKTSVPGSRIVLWGLGGVGKTKLAIEFTHQVRQQLPDTWVFWIHASSAGRCKTSVEELAERAKVPKRHEPNVNIFQLVGNWLRDENIKCILVLDNVDDDALLCVPSNSSDGPTQPPLRHLLHIPNGSVVVTSRNKGVALKITERRNLIEVPPMEQSEAMDLLKMKLNTHADDDEMAHLVEVLEYMPLAIIQAAAYISHLAPRYSVSQYLQKFQNSDHQAVRLLSHEASLLYSDWEAKSSIVLTWQISFDYIREKSPSAANLLSLMSLFDRQGIPDVLLQTRRTVELDEDLHLVKFEDGINESDELAAHDPEQFEEDLAKLRDFSLITVEETEEVVTMHRLVQLTVRVWLKTHERLEKYQERFITTLLCWFIVTEDPDDLEKTTCSLVFPHIQSVMTQMPESEQSLRQLVVLLDRGAEYAETHGNIRVSVEMASKSRAQRLDMFDAEHMETLRGNQRLAKSLCAEGRFEEAEILYFHDLRIYATKFGEEDCETLTIVRNLANVYFEQGRWKLAENVFEKVSEVCKKQLGENHPDTLSAMSGLALTYANQARYKEAEEVGTLVMKIRQKQLGLDHLDTLESKHRLALIYQGQGRFSDAEKLFTQALDSFIEKLGNQHPETLKCLSNLAVTYRDQGRWEEAEGVLTIAVQLSVQMLGAENPVTLATMGELASTYAKQGRLEEAKDMGELVMKTCKRILGEDHPATLESRNNLASTYQARHQWEKAEDLLTETVELFVEKLGAEHPMTLASMANLASTWFDRGRFEDGEKLLMQVVEPFITRLGEDNPDTLVLMCNLAFMKRSTAPQDAMEILRHCVGKLDLALGPAHPHTISFTTTLMEWEIQGDID